MILIYRIIYVVAIIYVANYIVDPNVDFASFL